jgi:hypothetical protein
MQGRFTHFVYQSLGLEIGKYISNNGIGVSLGEKSIWRSAPAKLQLTDNQVNDIWRTPSAKLENWSTPAAWLFNKLNYTSLAYLTSIKKRITRNTRGICRSFKKNSANNFQGIKNVCIFAVKDDDDMAEKRRYGIGLQVFADFIERKAVYVDKTAYVYKMAHSAGKHFFLRLYSKSGTRTMPCALQPTLVLCMPLV